METSANNDINVRKKVGEIWNKNKWDLIRFVSKFLFVPILFEMVLLLLFLSGWLNIVTIISNRATLVLLAMFILISIGSPIVQGLFTRKILSSEELMRSEHPHDISVPWYRYALTSLLFTVIIAFVCIIVAVGVFFLFNLIISSALMVESDDIFEQATDLQGVVNFISGVLVIIFLSIVSFINARLIFLNQVIAVENAGIIQAFGASWKLTKGRYLKISKHLLPLNFLSLILLLVTGVLIFNAVMAMGDGSYWIGYFLIFSLAFVVTCVSLFLYAYRLTYISVLYYAYRGKVNPE